MPKGVYPRKLGSRQQQVLALLTDGPMRFGDIFTRLGAHPDTVACALASLRKRGLVGKLGPKYGPGMWAVTFGDLAPIPAPTPSMPRPRPGFFRRVLGWLAADAR